LKNYLFLQKKSWAKEILEAREEKFIEVLTAKVALARERTKLL